MEKLVHIFGVIDGGGSRRDYVLKMTRNFDKLILESDK